MQLAKMEEFYNSLDSINVISKDLDSKREELKKYVLDFNANIQSLQPQSSSNFKNEDIDRLLTNSLNSIKASTSSWVKNFEELLKRSKFRDELKNYFIVIIFGKVKAGKSSLGNFIAQNRLSSQTINFFKYDEAGKEQKIAKLEEIKDDKNDNKKEGFKTANTECTIEIQGFTLSKLAWIDTPGLGSMTPENGELAREYIEAADYIIYPTSSDSPLQKDEKEQIKELFEQNKKVTVCITKSDEYIEDECECGSELGCEKCDEGLVKVLINKSNETRAKQEQWVRDEINSIIDSSQKSLIGDIISFSVHTAKEGIKSNNKELFKNSNIEKLYELMIDVVKHKSKELKSATPYDGLISFIDTNILSQDDKNSLTNIKSQLNSLKKKIKKSEEKIEKFKKSLDREIDIILFEEISAKDSEIDTTNAKEKFKEVDSGVKSRVKELIDKNLKEVFDSVSQEIEKMELSLTTNDFTVEKEYKTISHSYKDNSIWNLWGLLGDNYKTVYSDIEIGDNKLDTIRKYKEDRKKIFKDEVIKKYKSAGDEFFVPLKSFIRDVEDKVFDLSSSLEEFRNSLK